MKTLQILKLSTVGIVIMCVAFELLVTTVPAVMQHPELNGSESIETYWSQFQTMVYGVILVSTGGAITVWSRLKEV